MPQIQPGQVTPGVDGAPKLYGTDKTDNTVPFQQKLMDLFKPQEFVTIKNIDDAPVYWQYMPVDNENESFSEDGMQKQVNRGLPEMWVIEPGQVEVLVGASAYRALDVMYKNVTAKKTLRRYKNPDSQVYDETGNHVPRNFNFADGGTQDLFIEQAYLGKAVPSFQNFAPAEQPAVAAPVAARPQVQAQPMTAPVDPTIPKPKTTEGTPVAPVTYAEPDLDETINAAKKIAKNGAKV